MSKLICFCLIPFGATSDHLPIIQQTMSEAPPKKEKKDKKRKSDAAALDAPPVAPEPVAPVPGSASAEAVVMEVDGHEAERADKKAKKEKKEKRKSLGGDDGEEEKKVRGRCEGLGLIAV